MSKRYVLLKDLPDVKAGAILKQGDGGLYYYLGFHDEGHENSWYIKEVVEDNPDWFEEITDTPPNPTKSVEVNGVKYLSPEEVLEKEKKAFEAATKNSLAGNYCSFYYKYPTFEDYKKANP